MEKQMDLNQSSTPKKKEEKMNLLPYEEKVVEEIALHIVEPNAVARVLKLAGKPMESILETSRKLKNGLVKQVIQTIQTGVERGIIQTIRAARYFAGEKGVVNKYRKQGISLRGLAQIRNAEMEAKDAVADSCRIGNITWVGLEGMVMGAGTTLAEALPGAQVVVPSLIMADVAASITLFSRQACQLSTVYGYSPRDPQNIVHILGAMVPHADSSDEGYLVTKAIVTDSIREAGRFLAKNAGRQISREIIEKEAPQLIKLINYLAQRLGVILGQKELGILVPVAGAALNGGVNVAFQHVGHTTAKDYFRRLLLEAKYGEETIGKMIKEKIEEVKRGQRNL
jgi:hypothetical protein